MATGGGPSIAPMDPLSETVVNIIGSTSMDPISGVPDDDEEMDAVSTPKESCSVTHENRRETPVRKAYDLKQLVQEKIEQQRELHVAQMDLIATMKKAVVERNIGFVDYSNASNV